MPNCMQFKMIWDSWTTTKKCALWYLPCESYLKIQSRIISLWQQKKISMPARQNFQTSSPHPFYFPPYHTQKGKSWEETVPHWNSQQFTLGVLKASWAIISPWCDFIPLWRWPCLIKRHPCYCQFAFWGSI